ncbi:MAG: glycosyltransferase [Bacteroidota bacterium]
MKVLLLGDYSGYGPNLRDGLNALGHEVQIAVGQADWKSFYFDFEIKKKYTGISRYWKDRIYPFRILSKLTGFDIVQWIDPYPFFINYFPRKFFYEKIFNGNGKSFLVTAAMDAYFWRFAKEYLAYTPYNEMRKYDWDNFLDFKFTDRAFDFNTYVADQVNGIIAIMYDYEVSYSKRYRDKLRTIPLAVNLDKVEYKPIKHSRKLTFFHGLNRYGFKGTRYIEEAFSEICSKYPNDVEFILNKRMPFDQYIEVLSRSHVVVDQVHSYSYGMNALYSMASGKIVMSGAEPEALKAINIEEAPVINIRPDKEQIKKEILKLLEKRDSIEALGYQGREYVKKYHDHISVARQYVDFWNKS